MKFIKNERVKKQIDVMCTAQEKYGEALDKFKFANMHVNWLHNTITEKKMDLLKFQVYTLSAFRMSETVRDEVRKELADLEQQLPESIEEWTKLCTEAINLRLIKDKEEAELVRLKIEQGVFSF